MRAFLCSLLLFPTILSAAENPMSAADFDAYATGKILTYADGCVIGTHFKVDGDTWKAVDAARVNRFMDKLRTLPAAA